MLLDVRPIKEISKVRCWTDQCTGAATEECYRAVINVGAVDLLPWQCCLGSQLCSKRPSMVLDTACTANMESNSSLLCPFARRPRWWARWRCPCL